MSPLSAAETTINTSDSYAQDKTILKTQYLISISTRMCEFHCSAAATCDTPFVCLFVC